MHSKNGLFVVWLLSCAGLIAQLASLEPFNLNVPWPGYLGSVIAGVWLLSSAWLFLGLSPVMIIRKIKEKS